MPTDSGKIVRLRREGYDPFIDYLKGICIFFVILTHCLPSHTRHLVLFSLWGLPAVPIFLIIQVFHTYKKGMDSVNTNYAKLWGRVIKPFLMVELLLIGLTLGLELATSEFCGFSTFFIHIAKCGGRGYGAYYPWIYIQFAILLPIIAPLFKRLNGIYLAIIFIGISEFFEILCCITNMPQYLYRLLFFRYTFLIYLGYILVTKGYVMNIKTFLLSLLSALSILLFVYKKIDLTPFIFYAPKWRSCHWICYFYIAFFLFYVFKYMYQLIIGHEKICGYVKKMGRYSYEIFLFQMAYFCFHSYVIQFFSNMIENSLVVELLAVTTAVIVCVVPVVLYKDYKDSKKLIIRR